MGVTNRLYIERVAETSIGASTLRGHPEGTIKKVRNYLKTIKLEEFQCETAEDFGKVLDKHTIALSRKIKALDHRSEYWGSARKALNLFLGSVAYHAVLRKEYRFDRTEKFLEVPLDSQVANKLFSLSGELDDLPKWKTIKGLSSGNSKKFQDFANRYAKRKECTRIQLDVIFWRR
ncbi:hypothetical protein [Candidatus Villigracilis saccharophilus]|uniref:hypothetical protein n=1 Tax=Candidatus Villigracilis saccharophilus TaxID=3140684 RepID=UPI003135C522|nr:hypothetical protein [Anaerolineales bacterium]